MSIHPVLTFKAGKCAFDYNSSPPKVKPEPTPGYIYLYTADDITHFCWRPRSAPASEPDLDLFMVPGDGSFVPYTGAEGGSSSDHLHSPTAGRIFVLKFSSSSQRHLFWLQSKSQAPDGNSSWFSPRDQKLGQIVDMMLSGEDMIMEYELEEMRNMGSGRKDDDDDDPMEDVEGTGPGTSRPRQGSGGAGPGATGGDVREEGEEAREGGADGGRAASSTNPTDTSALVQNFLNSLKAGGMQSEERRFTTLADLLPALVTVPVLENAQDSLLDSLLANLPPTLLAIDADAELEEDADSGSDEVQAFIMSLAPEQKRAILTRVLRSPQLHQSLVSLTAALRDGGLPTVGDALKVSVPDGGWVTRGTVPVTGEAAIRAFLKGVKKTVREEEGEGGVGDRMDED